MRRGPEYLPVPQEGRETDRIISNFISTLVTRGVLRPDYGAKNQPNSFVFEPDGVDRLIQDTIKIKVPSSDPAHFSPTTFRRARYEQQVQRAFQQSVKTLVDRDIIPSHLAIQVGRIVRPGNIVIERGNPFRSGHFDFKGNDFPKDAIERRKMVKFGVNMATLSAIEDGNLYRLLRQNHGFTDEQIFRVYTPHITGHEYAHAVEWTLALLTKETLGLGVDVSAVKKRNGAAILSVSPQEELLQEYTEEPALTHVTRIPSERFATGIEYLNLQHVLEEEGFDKIEAEKIIEVVSSMRREQWTTFSPAVSVSKSHGISRVALTAALEAISGVLRKRDDIESLVTGQLLIEAIPRIHPNYFGYFFPLDEQQIRQYIDFCYGKN